MFDLKRPCNDCPFRKTTGHLYQFSRQRITEIVNAAAFQCHKTVDYSNPDPAGPKPQQCAGLIALLHKEGRLNQITQVATRMINYDPGSVEADDVYESIDDVMRAHEGGGRLQTIPG